MSSQLDELLEHVAAIGKIRELDYELRCMKAWKALAAKQIGFGEGDRVAICPSWTPPRDSGWGHYFECMAPGQVGTVRELIIDPERLRVSALTMWDTEWSTWTDMRGALRRTSSLRDRGDTRDVDRRHVFYFPVEHLRLANDDDHALQMPERADA
jgi:hypothetical protein